MLYRFLYVCIHNIYYHKRNYIGVSLGTRCTGMQYTVLTCLHHYIQKFVGECMCSPLARMIYVIVSACSHISSQHHSIYPEALM